jgi:hypothetical protein
MPVSSQAYVSVTWIAKRKDKNAFTAELKTYSPAVAHIC